MRVAISIHTARNDTADYQRAVLHRLAATCGWQPVGDDADCGSPGTTLNRPRLAALLYRIDRQRQRQRQRDIDGVCAYDQTRLARTRDLLALLLRRLADRNVEVLRRRAPHDPLEPDGGRPARRLPVAGHPHRGLGGGR